MRHILITGGTGTWGQEIVRQLLELKATKRIVVYSRAERSQEAMKRTIQDTRVEYILGDVCDSERINEAMIGIDTVFHTAAVKVIPNMENDCVYGYNINIYGTKNVVDAVINNEVARCVLVSTDKAVAPINAYGVSKAAAEHIVKQAVKRYPGGEFRIVRSGNIIGSSGSVLPLWKESLIKNNVVTITVPTMTRFFTTKQEAVQRLLTVFEKPELIQALISKGSSLGRLSEVAIRLWGDEYSRVMLIGNRGNEKMHEQILTTFDGDNRNYFSNDAEEYTIKELMSIIREQRI